MSGTPLKVKGPGGYTVRILPQNYKNPTVKLLHAGIGKGSLGTSKFRSELFTPSLLDRTAEGLGITQIGLERLGENVDSTPYGRVFDDQAIRFKEVSPASEVDSGVLGPYGRDDAVSRSDSFFNGIVPYNPSSVSKREFNG